MDALQNSLELLKKYLSETSVEERSLVWAEVKNSKISGPSVSDYLDSVQEEMEHFNNAFNSNPLVFQAAQFDFSRINLLDHSIFHSAQYLSLINGAQIVGSMPKQYEYIE